MNQHVVTGAGLLLMFLAVVSIFWKSRLQELHKHQHIETKFLTMDVSLVTVFFLGGLALGGSGVYLEMSHCAELRQEKNLEARLKEPLTKAVEEGFEKTAIFPLTLNLNLAVPKVEDMPLLDHLICRYKFVGEKVVREANPSKGLAATQIRIGIDAYKRDTVIEYIEIVDKEKNRSWHSPINLNFSAQNCDMEQRNGGHAAVDKTRDYPHSLAKFEKGR